MIMDVQIGVFCGVFSIFASLIVYAILSFYSIKEDSFDEAKANRRKLFKEYLDNRPSNEKPKPKKPKKVAKKVKEKRSDVVTEVDDLAESQATREVAPGVGVTPAELPKRSEPLKSLSSGGAPASSKAGKSSPGTGDEANSSPLSPAASSSEAQMKKPLDKKTKVKAQERKAEVEAAAPVPPQANSNPANLKEAEKKFEKKIEVKNDKKKVDPAAALNTKKQPTGSDKQGMNVNSILTIIQKAELSRSEIQMLIDILLNSEDEKSDWLKVRKLESGRHESSDKLKKQISELELSLKNEKQITTSLQNKLKEVRTEMASDKSSISVLKDSLSKAHQDKDDLLHEKNDLACKLKAITDEKHEIQGQLNKELVKIQQLQTALDDERYNETILALKDEISTMRGQMEAAQSEVDSLTGQLGAAHSEVESLTGQLEAAQSELDNLTGQLEATQTENLTLKSSLSCLQVEFNSLQNRQDQIIALERALNVSSEKLREKDSEMTSLRQEIESLSSASAKSKKEILDVTKEKKSLTTKLTAEIERLKQEVETLSRQLDSSKENREHARENGDTTNGFESINYQEILEEKDKDLLQLRKQLEGEVKSLAATQTELSAAVEAKDRLQTELQHSLSDLSAIKETFSKLDASHAEKEKLVDLLRSNISNLNAEIKELKQEVDSLNQKLKAEEGKPSGEVDSSQYESLKLRLEEKDNQLKEAEIKLSSEKKNLSDRNVELLNSNNTLKSHLEKAHSELAKLKEDVLSLKAINSQKEDAIAHLSGSEGFTRNEIQALKDEIENYKQRNNELRNKNWKVAQALSDAEKALQNKLKSEEHENQGNNNRNVEELKNNVNTFIQRLFPDLDIQDNKGHFKEWLSSVEDAVSQQKTATSPSAVENENKNLQSLVINYKKIISDTEQMLNELQNHIEIEESKWREKEFSYQKEIENLRAHQSSSS